MTRTEILEAQHEWIHHVHTDDDILIWANKWERKFLTGFEDTDALAHKRGKRIKELEAEIREFDKCS